MDCANGVPEGFDDWSQICICSSYDGRGYSCCGIECPMHKLNGNCPACGIKIYDNQLCFPCQIQADPNYEE